MEEGGRGGGEAGRKIEIGRIHKKSTGLRMLAHFGHVPPAHRLVLPFFLPAPHPSLPSAEERRRLTRSEHFAHAASGDTSKGI